MLSEISKIKTNTIYLTYMWNLKKAKIRKTESRVVVTRDWRDREDGEMLVKLPAIRLTSSGYPICNMAIIVNNSVLYTLYLKVKRVNLKCYHIKMVIM